MPLPGYTASIDADAAFLAEQGITLVVTLTTEPLAERPFARHGISLLHLPVRDFTAPTLDKLETFVKKAEEAMAAGGRVAVHCAYGVGRTGTFLAAFLVHEGRTAEEAISEVRRLRPGSIETPEQVAAIKSFAARSRG
jgi:atypical dual specificity phosphatase